MGAFAPMAFTSKHSNTPSTFCSSWIARLLRLQYHETSPCRQYILPLLSVSLSIIFSCLFTNNCCLLAAKPVRRESVGMESGENFPELCAVEFCAVTAITSAV